VHFDILTLTDSAVTPVFLTALYALLLALLAPDAALLCRASKVFERLPGRHRRLHIYVSFAVAEL
jgi:hypothetical protein